MKNSLYERAVQWLESKRPTAAETHFWWKHQRDVCQAALSDIEEFGGNWLIRMDQFDHGDWEPDYLLIMDELKLDAQGNTVLHSHDVLTPCLRMSSVIGHYDGGCDVECIGTDNVKAALQLLIEEAEEQVTKYEGARRK